ncbi:ABA4-like family protein [Parasphingopyxis sp.]|uniref:ABA4-like family protein n=1 Tax=Parasphingopyxis sp. TaxID=1920299 RepID=UPI002624A382|nr:ABA4-like family protein [Parasphingopyxis sp.]
MDWPTIFSIANLFALLAWVALIFGPRREIVFTVLREGVVGLLSLFYAALLIYLMVFAPAPGGAGPDFSTIEGVRTIFATDAGLTLGWVHYLAFDLFVGLWVARNADAISLSRIVQAPILLATFLFGPMGLCIYLIVRRIHGMPKTA